MFKDFYGEYKIMILSVAAFCTIVVALTAFQAQSVDAGNEGVVVKKPLFFGHGGVDKEPVKTGLVWTARTTTVVPVSVRPFNKSEEFADMVTADNNPVSFAIHLTFQHIEGKTPILYEKFGDAWYTSKIKEPLRTDVRSFVKEQSMFQITTNPVTAEELQKVVTTKVRMFIAQNKIPTQLVNVSVGKVLAPPSVIAATNETANQKQNAITQQAIVKTQQARELAQRATAKADKAYMLEMNLSPAQYLKNKELDIIREKTDVKVFLGTSPVPMVKGD